MAQEISYSEKIFSKSDSSRTSPSMNATFLPVISATRRRLSGFELLRLSITMGV